MSLNKLFCMIFIICAISEVYSYRIVSKNSEVKSNTPNRDIIHVPKTTTPNPNSFTPQPPKRNESPLGKAYRDWGNLKYNLADRYDKLSRDLGYQEPTIIGGLLRLCAKYTHDYADYVDNYYG
ncbi:uncharacterized protein LOC103570302 [Microplitis demolitor]|uniref:uncharacterized protein LOC103570302 n=1 Tax=Microplitis demolitor TaxID=69319 RepID=UPI00043FFECF|nr:uncharacterized protein LOC103570302 [Microplitis demolitor]